MSIIGISPNMTQQEFENRFKSGGFANIFTDRTINYYHTIDDKFNFECINKLLKKRRSCHRMFEGVTFTEGVTFEELKTEYITDMSLMFHECKGVVNLEGAKWDVSSVTDMHGMFKDCESVTVDLSQWNFFSVTNMAQMFQGTNLTLTLGDIKLNTNKVNNMESMFRATIFDVDQQPSFKALQTRSVTTMKSMFKNSNLGNPTMERINLAGWNVSKVRNMSEMFANLPEFDGEIPSSWSHGSMTNCNGMFVNSTKFNNDGKALPLFPKASKMNWLAGTLKARKREKALLQFCPGGMDNICTRCYTVYDELDNIGQWKCSYHPSPLDGDRYTCCNTVLRKRKRERLIVQYGFHTPAQGRYKTIGGRQIYVPYILEKGCTACDHGTNLAPVVLTDLFDLADYLNPDILCKEAVEIEAETITISRYKRK